LLTKRIIPCLDIKDGKTVKGINFENLRDAGDPVELAALYAQLGADELVFLDITATVEGRKTLAQLVKNVAKVINIPFTVGGGISSIADAALLLENGADKVSINSSAVRNPSLINDLAKEFGSQFVTVAIDTRNIEGEDVVHTHGGRTPTALRTQQWARQVQDLGSGEILLTSMDHDGVKLGFNCILTAELSQMLSIPVIASGGAGKMEHFKEVFIDGRADAALAASIFHFKEIEISSLKEYLKSEGIEVRI
jgi:cyclase